MKFKIKKGRNHFTYNEGEINCKISFGKKKNWFWLYFYNKKYDKKFIKNECCKPKPHFCLTIKNIISLDTAHMGKKLWGRLSLMKLGKKDFTVYTSREGNTQSQC